MKKLSLRWRLTLVTVAVLAAICAFMSAFSVVNVVQMMSPVTSEVESIGTIAQDFSNALYYVAPGTAKMGVAADDEALADVPLDYKIMVSDEKYWYGEEVYLSVSSSESDETVLMESENLKVVSVADQTAEIAQQAEAVSFTISMAQQSFSFSSLVFMFVMIILGGVLVYFASGYALKPVRALSSDIKAIGGEQLSHRVDTGSGAEEINYLEDSFNGMLERLERAFSAQKRFSTAAAHELKTPIAAIRTNIDVLKMDETPTREDYTELLEVVTRQTDRMSRLVDDLFAMSSLQEYELEETIPLGAMLRSVTEELTVPAEEKGIRLTLDAPVECTLKGNQVMLSRAVSNIVENGIRYTPSGGAVALRLRVEKGRAVVTVSDSGPGIGEEHLQNIFDPFYRVDPSRSRSLGGAGLGLAIVSEITVMHGGRIEAANREEGGSVFTMTLPCEQLPD